MPKIDLHTHSTGSVDGSINMDQYKFLLDNKIIDVIAITDHDSIVFAQKAQEKLGKDKIIVGEEISTLQGEIIGLYLSNVINPKQSALETVKQIKAQGGIVLIPHPFETVRKGVTIQTLDSIAEYVDMVEAPNGRSLQPGDKEAIDWAKRHKKSICGNSDAHRAKAIGKTYTVIEQHLSKETLTQLLGTGRVQYKKPSLFDLLAPKFNRYVRKRLQR